MRLVLIKQITARISQFVGVSIGGSNSNVNTIDFGRNGACGLTTDVGIQCTCTGDRRSFQNDTNLKKPNI